MKKLLTLALIAFFALISPSANSQSVLLINGKAAQVTLTGDQINSIVQQQIENYMEAYDQAPTDNFSKAEVRINTTKSNGRLADLHASVGLSEEEVSFLSSDRPFSDFKKE